MPLEEKLRHNLKIGISKKNLIDGAYYAGQCRNSNIARWQSSTEEFFYCRKKFNRFFVESIQHMEDAEHNRFDYFTPLFAIEEKIEISFTKWSIDIEKWQSLESVQSTYNEMLTMWNDEIREQVYDFLLIHGTINDQANIRAMRAMRDTENT